MAGRLKAMGQAKYQRDGDPRTSGPGFGLTVHPDALDIPLRRRKPTLWFVNSMSDLFHKDVPAAFIARVFSVMARAEQHTFQVLTKRPQRMSSLFYDEGDGSAVQALLEDVWDEELARSLYQADWPLPNVWLGTSIENDRYAWRADDLRATPAAVRFLSLEPLLGPLPSLDLTGIDWVIVGGESGPTYRPMELDWLWQIQDMCDANAVPLFVKQAASDRSGRQGDIPDVLWARKEYPSVSPLVINEGENQ